MAHINSLPRAILTNIFKLLCLKDRKSIRLTCPLWYEVCNSSEFNEDEKFAIHCIPNDEPTHSRWPCACRTHWEFHGLELKRLPESLLQTCANKIQVLFIYNCTIDELTFVKIVGYCRNLIRFCIEINDVHPSGTMPCLEPLFDGSAETFFIDHFIWHGIKRPKLISFELYSFISPGRITSMPSRMCWKIFSIYPNTRTFCYGFGRKPKRFLNSFTIADGCINPYAEWPCPQAALDLYNWINHSMMKELRRQPLNESETCDDLLEYFSYKPELERVGLQVDLQQSKEKSRSYLLFQILERLPKLKEFLYDGRVCAGPPAFLLPTEFQQFMEYICNLEAFALRDTSVYVAPLSRYVCKIKRPLKLQRLKKLYLGSIIDDTIVVHILERCGSSLKFLRLDLTVNREMTQKLFENDTSLETLQVTYFQEIYAYPNFLPDHDYSRCRFRNLKRLDLKYISGCDFNAFMSELDASKLEYITFPRSLYVHTVRKPLPEMEQHEIIGKALNTLASNAPRLRIICFNEVIPLEPLGLIEVCKRLEKLEIIHVRRGPNFLKTLVDKSRDLVVRLFIECPSLRWLISDAFSSYTYDHCSRKLMEYGYRACTFKQEYNAWYKD